MSIKRCCNRNQTISIHSIGFQSTAKKNKGKMFSIFCAVCDHEEQSLDDLGLHIMTKHSNKKSSNIKSSTNKNKTNFFNDKSSQMKITMKFVKEVDEDKENLSCHECSDRKFSSKSALLRHIRITHLKMNKFACCECDKVFPEQGKLNQHLRKSHTLVPEVSTHEADDDLVLEVSTDFASNEDDHQDQHHVKAVAPPPRTATKMFPIFNQKKGKKLPIGCGVKMSHETLATKAKQLNVNGHLPTTTRIIPLNDEVSIIYSSESSASPKMSPPSKQLKMTPQQAFTTKDIISPQTKNFINKFLAKDQAKMHCQNSAKSSYLDVIKSI